MKTRIIGDIHGQFYDYQVAAMGAERSIQVGDFGIGFHGDYWHDKVDYWFKENPQHRFIRGNHDDPDRCKTISGYIDDGLVEDGVMYVGGAWSIDHAWRTPGINWWENEELSYEELEKMIDIYSQVKPRVMITHDCPARVSYQLFILTGRAMGTDFIPTRTSSAFQAMFEIHEPELWLFGHWHDTKTKDIGNTTFMCLGIMDYIDVNI